MEKNIIIPKIHILGCYIHKLSMDETVSLIDQSIQKRVHILHMAVNAAKIVNIHKDSYLRQAVLSSDLINADGQAVVWASKFLGQPLTERVTGIDLMSNLMALSYKRKYKIFFFGAKEEVVKKVVEYYATHYDANLIAGYRNGYYSTDQEAEIARMIAESKADILFVAMTSPKKEIFLNTYKDVIGTPFIMGVGGSFDVVSGITKRAPAWMQKSGLEWLYRIFQEPSRMWKRYLITNTQFISMVFRHKLGFDN